MALQGFNASVKVQSSAVAFTDEATTSGDDTIYTITDSSKSLWDLNTAITVEDSATPTTESFTISRLTGTITFETAVSRTITVTGAFVVPTLVATAKSYSFAGTTDVFDNTPFLNSARTFQAGLLSGTAEISRFYVTDSLFYDEWEAGNYMIVEFYVDLVSDPIRFFGLISSDTIDSPVEGLIMEAISFQISTEIEV